MIGIWLTAFFPALLMAFYLWYKISGLGAYYADHRILMMHGIREHFDLSVSNLSRKQIETFIEECMKQDFQIKPLEDLLPELDREKPSGKSVYLTFDDGYEELYDFFYEYLKPRDIPITIFLTAGFIGKGADWDYKPQKACHLSHEKARKLASEPLVTFGSHSLTHPDLTAIGHDNLIEEISRSKAVLEKSLGINIEYFSYPFGRFNGSVLDEVNKFGYKAAFCGVPARYYGANNIFALPRIPLNLLDNLYTFNAKIRPAPLSWMEFSKSRVIELFSALTHLVRRNS